MSVTSSSEARLRRIAGGLTIVLPGSWVNVPLGTPEETTAFVRRVVRERVGRADRLARMRRMASDEFAGNARDAAAIGVHTYLMALELFPGVPFPAAVLFFDADWPQGTAPGADAPDDVVGRSLEAAFPGSELGRLSSGGVSREVECVPEPLEENLEEGRDAVRLRIDYRIPYPDRSRLLVARATVPSLPSAEPFATLIDAIMDSIQFPAPAGTEVR